MSKRRNSKRRNLLRGVGIAAPVLGTALVLLMAGAARAQQAETGVIDLDTINVFGASRSATGPVNGYVAPSSATGTKTNTPLIETPQSISVISREQIEAQGARTIAQALRYEPGVVSETRGGGRYDTVFIRGFGGFGGNANYVQYWDNLRFPKGVSYNVASIDPYLVERVEVLRGPASILYGQNNPGGLINLVSKRPTAEPSNEIFTRLGNNGLIESGFDVGGRADKDGTLLYRVVGLGRYSETDVDHTHEKRFLIAPSFTWRPSDATSLTIQASYQHDPKSFYTYWMPALGTLQANPNGRIPYKFFSGNPSFDGFERTQSSIGYQFEHRFDDVWTIRQNARYVHVDSDFKALSVSGFGAASTCGGVANLCLARSATRYIESLDSALIDNNVEANLRTGPLEHKLLMGLDYQWQSADARYGTGTTSYLNYRNPVYGPVAEPALTTYQEQTRQQLGVYVQDQVKFGNWRALFGLRHDWSRISTNTTALTTGTGTQATTTDEAFTGKAGLLYEFDNGIAPYVSYSTSFEPTTGTGYGGLPFKATTGQQYEAGVKYKPTAFEGLFTLSAFNLTQQNVLTTDLAHTSTNTATTLCSSTTCQTQTGEVRSRGIEFGGKVTPFTGFNLVAAYTYTDAEVTKSAVSGVTGKVPAGVPAHTASLWGDYRIQSGAFRGLGLGLGVRYIGSSYGDQTNTDAMRVPAYTLVDAGLNYDFAELGPVLRGWRGSINATNLFDKRYVSACASTTQCFYGAGRAVVATLAYRW
jgi:iron complex outermembrane receptor protein